MLLFLDIDGVMVPTNSWRRPEILDDGFPAFGPKATEALRRIISSTGAGIVLTTSHKSKYTLKEWRDILKRRGIGVTTIKRLPENNNYLNRKDELVKWFVANPVRDNFIIIDDDKSLNGLPGYLKNRLVQTSGSVGLTDDLADRALELLEKNHHELV
ncbi:HAD domain-containing protein [Parapedobacter sp. DT-150]|uniref:HAD domain-containing protein n=1 Tax=Parapedobacter sp. DT-150 TaxID=3396162 RepID=UPI003F196E99